MKSEMKWEKVGGGGGRKCVKLNLERTNRTCGRGVVAKLLIFVLELSRSALEMVRLKNKCSVEIT